MRYLPLCERERAEMCSRIGVASIEELFHDIPASVRLDAKTQLLPEHLGEIEVETAMRGFAAENRAAGDGPFFIGAGAYRHHVPASVDHLVQRSEFMTSYTPYQAEIAQGNLQAMFEFQSLVSLLTGMDIANSSMYDGSTACSEAVAMAHRITGRKKAVLAGGLHPHYREVVETMSRFAGNEVQSLETNSKGVGSEHIDDETSCVVVQTPDFFGNLHDITALGEAAHKHGALLVAVTTEVVSLGLLRSPGSMGADITAAEGQSLGNGLNFGGPYVGLFATREKHLRKMPGRLVGETTDEDGRRGFVLTLSAREQHIRRQNATSNICTNSNLCAMAFAIHLALLGEQGLQRLARINHARAVRLADMLDSIAGVKLVNENFFNEFTIEVEGRDGIDVIESLARENILGGVPAARFYPDDESMRSLVVVAATELCRDEDMQKYRDSLQNLVKGKSS
ncbi:MAG: aminomethyl-transferring glycine dehydrogenase subunit GcvPA [Hyphomicrobiales bacterium]|nr:aminomethyl-transferring glycine dehydrogenase subunit GcvPA [Hyphomicrobiales bacterium]